VIVQTDDPLSGLETQPGVHNVVREGSKVKFSLDNSQTTPVMSFLSARPIQHLTSTAPTLEELFMSHYTN
jgi:ABC-2 type transport system ATP-binding protein